MSARDVIAGIHYKPLTEHTLPIGILFADCVLEALTAAGFSIVHKDEIHAPSVERCIDQELFRRLDFGSENKGAALEADECRSIANALRELMKEVGRG